MGGFVIAGGDAAKVFDFIDEALDQMAFLVEFGVMGEGLSAGAVSGDHGGDVAAGQVCPEGVGIEGLVGDEDLDRDASDQRCGLGALMHLAGGEAHAQRIAERIDGDVQLGTQPAARAPDGVILSPPFAPAACWWARTMVESMITYSKSGSLAKALKRLAHTPFFDHRGKRRQTLFQLPNAGGKSRQGAPVRAIHKTASMNRRSSRPVAPQSPFLPGIRSLMYSHYRSVKPCRYITRLLPKTQSEALNHNLHLEGIPFNVHRT